MAMTQEPIDWRYLPYIRPIFQGIPIDNTFQDIFLGNEHPQLPAFFLMFTGVANAVRHLSPDRFQATWGCNSPKFTIVVGLMSYPNLWRLKG